MLELLEDGVAKDTGRAKDILKRRRPVVTDVMPPGTVAL
jgi:hypothetical protein